MENKEQGVYLNYLENFGTFSNISVSWDLISPNINELATKIKYNDQGKEN